MEKKVNLSDYDPTTVPNGEDFRIGITVAEWNPQITNALFEGTYSTLRQYGVKEENIPVIHVPGSFELTSGAQMLLNSYNCQAAICIGCVIQGETRHFDFICNAVSNGITKLSLETEKPVIFSVLTPNNMEQALDRAGGKHGNKGVEGAITALKMVRNYVDAINFETQFFQAEDED